MGVRERVGAQDWLFGYSESTPLSEECRLVRTTALSYSWGAQGVHAVGTTSLFPALCLSRDRTGDIGGVRS